MGRRLSISLLKAFIQSFCRSYPARLLPRPAQPSIRHGSFSKAFRVLTTLVLLATLAANPQIAAGEQLTYELTITADKDDGTPQVKRIQLNLLVEQIAGENATVGWSLAEEGRGTFSWLEHYGRASVNLLEPGDSVGGPAVLLTHSGGRSVVPIAIPLASTTLSRDEGAMWTAGGLNYKTLATGKRQEIDAVEIESRGRFGHRRSFWIAAEDCLMLDGVETLFVGQGEQQQLKFKLVSRATLASSDSQEASQELDQWIALRDLLKREVRTERPELSAEQLTTLKTELPKLIDSQKSLLLKQVATSADKEVRGQKSQQAAIAALREAILGKEAGDLTLVDLLGKVTEGESYAGKVVVLHFWKYTDSPLEEPYGQIGYLDFLARKRAADGVVTLGVHCDPELSDAETRRGSLSAARRLRSFMNLSYPIMVDDGKLLDRLGDPRSAGAALPLFVVIGKDGKVTTYHAGLYEVNPREGLAELSTAISAAVGAKP
ncbi:alkyl hydroperoxide reductase/ Thiol specific antioxidant/ Mal allergen [Pirellula staleyi DSM 6068]|uniref:Alkyl hydroperoxide reductase/ Thiol specific antioxidant/ Mal allergen n=1 Tax=Pirellula staleyi (strain ATCC 27377 / DSM 6068 / ICPB 4128) TaxID=530564 RepID=D2R248_PIRSD|nr:alkyl hydroperoxide reductase/ Thiol specific antioxidant/ Mal allergen [Pirellula staleyi DSM 6068]